MRYNNKIIFFILIFFAPVYIFAQQGTGLQGAWQLASQKIDGKDHPISGRQIKLVTANHFAWLSQDKKQLEELLAKGTAHDSAAAYHDMGGAGTYKVSGNTYTETTEFFYDPQNIGTSIDWKYKLKGKLWYTSGHYIHYKDGKKIEDILLEQVWKKIE
jgi:predicted NAD-dependent protein-ADP-ribosyltransferase YbiA (DUF1768 family)